MTVAELVNKIPAAEGAEALSVLCQQAKTADTRRALLALLADGRILFEAAHAAEAKKRKNAYRLIGALKDTGYLPLLRERLQAEETLFCLPSLLLSLGALGDLQTLEDYEPPVSESAAMDKHVAEIILARRKALQSLEKKAPVSIDTLPGARTVYCYAPEGFTPLLGEELRSLGFAVVTGRDFCRVETADMARLYRAERMTEALMPVKKDVPLTPEAIAAVLKEMPAEPYRLELRGYTRDRRRLITALTGALGGENNPSAYVWELRIDCRESVADIYWKLFYPGDSRYRWRARALPASIHPALGACLAAYAAKLVKTPSPRVLDPFSGSGSLLFCMEKLLSCRQLLGVDKSSSAVEAARENARAGSSAAAFITKDILRFIPRDGFDLVLSNMPFGNRVGNHETNRVLYEGFLKKLPYLLSDNGVAVLYTMEYRLLQSCLKHTRGLRIRDTKRTEAGGLLPWIFVIDKEPV